MTGAAIVKSPLSRVLAKTPAKEPWSRTERGQESQSPKGGSEEKGPPRPEREFTCIWKAGKGKSLGLECLRVLLNTLVGILASIVGGGRVASFGEGMALSSWKVRRLDFLERWKKFKGE